MKNGWEIYAHSPKILPNYSRWDAELTLRTWERMQTIQEEVEREQYEAYMEAFLFALLLAAMVAILLLYWRALHG